MNNVNLIGRLVRDPMVGAAEVSKFTLAIPKQLTKEKREEMEAKGQPTADFIGCTTFGGITKVATNNLKKGALVGISGRLQSGQYEKNGQMIYTTDVIVNSITLIDWPEDVQQNQLGQQNQGYQQPQQSQNQGYQQPQQNQNTGYQQPQQNQNTGFQQQQQNQNTGFQQQQQNQQNQHFDGVDFGDIPF